MCGIAGFAGQSAGTARIRAAVALMNVRMASRGPDAHSIWSAEGVVLGHRRLAILDLDPRANQPMESSDGRFVVVYNGEVYNFRQLRSDLEKDGATFRTLSDTEVLLTMYAREGPQMLHKLRGMFAFAIWDKHAKALFLARDPYGIKPLYYSNTADGFVFASQVKALIATGLVREVVEPAGVAGFYLWGSIPEPWTTVRDVFALPAGHWVKVQEGVSQKPVEWHDIRQHWTAKVTVEPRDLQSVITNAVTDSIRAHLVSDVPVSVFLSGGVDSAVVAAAAAMLGQPVEGITISFAEFAGGPNDESPTAAAIASHYNLPHTVRQVSRSEFKADLPKIVDAMDQPSIDGVNTWFASKAASERGYKVALSGIGGDELFCGYSSFSELPKLAWMSRVSARVPGVDTLLRIPCRLWARRSQQPKLAAMPQFMGSLDRLFYLKRALFLPSELPLLMGLEAADEGLTRLENLGLAVQRRQPADALSAIAALESTIYLRNQLLRDSDWASMAHSLELRTPLVDIDLLQTIGQYAPWFGAGAGKALLAGVPTPPLPRKVVSRKKTGFGVPVVGWLDQTRAPRELAGQSTASSGSQWARSWAQSILGSSVSVQWGSQAGRANSW